MILVFTDKIMEPKIGCVIMFSIGDFGTEILEIEYVDDEYVFFDDGTNMGLDDWYFYVDTGCISYYQ